ncbi:MAG TPA: sulfotransferase [Pirellulales bacterium]|nr:sulfotransferase [Pirellulales bacterium]
MGTLRSWLVSNVHRLLGSSQLHEQLQQTNELLRHLSVAIAASESLGPVPALGVSPGNPSTSGPSCGSNGAALRSLAQHGLFVVGCARSGTTILTRCLNRASEVMLLEEPYFFLHEGVADFSRFFNDRQASLGNRRRKGTYVPPAIAPEFGPLGLMCRLQREYRFVGEKVAFGPQDFPPDWCQRYLDFQSKHFAHSRYVLIMRTPVESLWSMHRMFPEAPIPRLFETWLRTTALLLDAYQIFADSRMVFFDDLKPTLIASLSDWLEAPIRIEPGTLDRKYVHSALPRGGVPEPLLAFEELCGRLTRIYDDLRTSFCKDRLVYNGGVNQWSFFHDVHARIEQLLDELVVPPHEVPATVKKFVVRMPRLRGMRRKLDAPSNIRAAA